MWSGRKAYIPKINWLQENISKVAVACQRQEYKLLECSYHQELMSRRRRRRSVHPPRMHGCHRNTNSFRKNFHIWKVLKNYVTRRDEIQ